MSRAGQQPAELATVIAQAASFGGPAVAFEITHRTREYLEAPLTLPSEWADICRETLAFDLPGAGFRIHTGFAGSPASTMAGLGSLTAKPCPGGFAYWGTASLNPRFLYDSARDHELLLSVGEQHWAPDHADAVLLAQVLAQLAAAAASEETAAPILLLQSPVAPYRPWPPWPESRTGEPPKIARGMAIRFSAGVDSDNSDGRLALIHAAVEIARDHGLQLHLADRRFGRVRGEWKEAVAYVPERYQECRAAVGAVEGAIRQAALVTFVGPARVGSSAALLKVLAECGVGVLAVVVASLQDLAFVNLAVAVPRDGSGRAVGPDERVMAADGGLRWLVDHCGGSGVVPPSIVGASDYQACLTGPMAWEADADAQTHPLWLQWHTAEAEHESLMVVDDVLAELLNHSDVVTEARLAYCRSRMMGDGRVCSAKLAIRVTPGPEDELPDRLSVLCRMTQANVEWKWTHERPEARSVGLKVAWRERWLGRVKSTGVG